MAKSKFFRVAVEGATTDGRVIERAWIDQMAAGYNPATYSAGINCEHIAGYSPEPPFNSYGSVVAVKAEDFTLQLDGKSVTRRALYAQVDANDQLVGLSKKKQKLFPSIEVSPNFAATGKAGLVGLAVTDNPASLGTEMMQFAAGAGDANPFASRKKDKDNLFSAVDDGFVLEIEEDKAGLMTSISDAIAAGFAKFSKAPEATKKEEPATAPAALDVAAFSVAIGEQMTGAIGKFGDSIDARLAPLFAMQTDFAALKTRLETEPANQFNRAPANGGANAHLTDC